MWQKSKSGIIVLSEAEVVSVSDALPPQGRISVARIDGESATDSDGVFDQFSTAFKFPSWFGWNWNALSDCLRDLDWLPSDRYLTVVEAPEKILVDDMSFRKDLFQILSRAAKHWANPLGNSIGSTVVFQTVFVVSDDYVDQLRSELGELL